MTTYSEAVEQTITAGEQIHQIVNGTSTTEVTVEDGSKVPSIRKALLDNFYFKDPITWQVGQTENVFNQLRQFTDGSWWYAPSATASNPISMGVTPVGNPLWKIYDFDAIGKLEPRVDEALRRSYAEAGYNVVGTFKAGFTYVNANDVGIDLATGKGYAGPSGTVAAGTNPASGGFVDVSNSLRHVLFSSAFGLAPSNSASKNSKALRDLAAAAMALGTAKIIFEKGDYTVGVQYLTGAVGLGGAWRPLECFKVTGMKRIDIEFDGCKFKWADGMRFGAFDPVTGFPVTTDASNVTNGSLRSDKGFVFDLRDNDQVNISGNIEFDGNTEQTILGGWWAVLNERQNWDYGIYAKNNRQYNDTAVKYFHSSSCDGYAFTGSLAYNASFDISNLVAVYCGRNGLSFTGGINGSFNNIVAGYSGYKNLSSLPAAAIDVEPQESSRISGVSMNNVICLPCKGQSLQGAYYVTPSNTSIIEDITFNNLKAYGIRGEQSPMLWYAQNTRFNKCQFFGAVHGINAVAGFDGNVGKIIFDDCDFNSRFDNADRSYGYRDIATIIQMGDQQDNVIFRNCRGRADISTTNPTAIRSHKGVFDGFNLTLDGYFTDATAPSVFWAAYLNFATLNRFNVINNLLTEFTSATTGRFGIAAFDAKVDNSYISLGQFGFESVVWNTNYNAGRSGKLVQKVDPAVPVMALTYRSDLSNFKESSLNIYAVKLNDPAYINKLDVGINRGDLLTVADFVTGGKPWLKCVTAGTATTRTTTALGTTTLGSNVATLTTLSGLKVGDYIKIGAAYPGTPPKILSMNTTALTVKLSYNPNAAVTGGAVTLPAPVFE
ncbi:putative tail fiber protein [Aeromonas phage phiA019]|nr:putative tail fiber protein [Aeromonas phage phiA009]ULG01611.1 putative tail fiber protein [Aeromonas phage phiA019]